ncbi:hypothetical protein BpHYR1_032769 [Brachionus plicatilis]|uniref:Uncharacterized protein n=1 Tax=Brachionus plicatilis TaxID=10195 RepID=A0A3M7QG36_BRAPC|nr:hypothetical protein BpHYR1_032769 [Brachionus plicatilis]
MAIITIPTSKYRVHKAAIPLFSVAKVFFPGTKSPKPIVNRPLFGKSKNAGTGKNISCENT